MEFRKVLALRGPNIWANFPVLEAWVDLGKLKDSSSDEMPGFNERLQTWLPSLIEHRCSVGTRGGFYERLRRGTYLAHILEHVALELQSLVGPDVGFGRTRMANEDGVYKVALEYEAEELGREALETARRLCLAAVHDRPFDVAAEVARLRELAQRVLPSPGQADLLQAARKRRIPVRQLTANGPLLFGYGAQQRLFVHGQTDRTSAVAASIAYDTLLTRSLLRSAGVPVPEGRSVTDAADAWTAAQELDGPVIVRPQYGTHRHGARPADLNQAAVEAAYAAAREHGRAVLVEKLVVGGDYRLLVVGDKMVAALRRESAPAACTCCPASDVTDQVHPEVAARAVDAARVIGLDIAGIDLVASDISRPLEEQGGVIVAVRSKPALRRHVAPASGTPRPVGQAIVDHLFPGEANGRIPIVGVTGANGKTTVTRLIAHILSQTYGMVGMTCTEGIYFGHRRVEEGDCSGPKSARKVLQNPQVNAAVLEVARGGILREGLGFDKCDVAVMTNIGEGDHLGCGDIDTAEQLAWVKSTLVSATAKTGAAVLNAADPLVAGMAEQSRGAVIYFARDPNNAVIVKHRAAEGRAVFVRDGRIILAEGATETELVSLTRVPLTQGGRVGFHVENALASAAAAWWLGLPLTAIATGLETFGLEQTPARFNLLDIAGATVVLDYGHNISALISLVEALDQFPHRWRTAVYSAAGDRRDQDIIRQGEILGNHFDRVILYEDAYLRGRKEGEIMALFRQGLVHGQRVREIHEIRGGCKAVDQALALSRPGDLILVQPDTIDETLRHLQPLLGNKARETSLDQTLQPQPTAEDILPTEGALLEVRDGSLGKCVHTARTVAKNQLLFKCWGPRLPDRTRHSIQVDEDYHILPPPPLAFFNHSCEPNCGLLIRSDMDVMEVHSLRPIAAGEELCLDYATFEYEVQHMVGPCLCNTAACREVVSGYKDLPAEIRQAYGPYIAEYLREMDAEPVEEPLPVVIQPALGV